MNGEHKTTGDDMPAAGAAPERLLRLPAVLGLVALGRTAVLDRVKAGSFPQPVKIGRATCWREAEVFAWVRERVRAHREVQR